MELCERAAYIKGLIDGLGIDNTTKEGKVILAMSDLLAEMSAYIEELDSDISELYDEVDEVETELDAFEDAYFEDEDGDDEYEEEMYDDYEITCDECGTINITDEETLLSDADMYCSNCHEKLNITLPDEN